MSELTKKINNFIKYATRTEINEIKDELCLDEHLEQVFNLFYIKRKSIDFIAFETGYSKAKINSDLAVLRRKMAKLYTK